MAQLCKVVVLDVVALTRDLVTIENTPFFYHYTYGNNGTSTSTSSSCIRDILPAFPALTCTSQATYMSGKGAAAHGLVGNGFYDRDYCEVKNWHQSAKLVQCERLWHRLKRENPDATMFLNSWWHGMHDDSIDYFINVRPQYLQDGGKKPDVYTRPANMRDDLQGALGVFPLHRFWGPGAGIEGSQWIAEASKRVDQQYNPTFTAVYLPHLDYALQIHGPHDTEHLPAELQRIDKVVEDLVTFYEQKGAKVVILSEYGISPVDTPIYLNRELRKHGLIKVRTENGGETLDCGECAAFAVCDHQIAHVYVSNKDDVSAVKVVVTGIPGIAQVLEADELNAFYEREGHGSGEGRQAHHKKRSGDLVAIADDRSWFAYYYWLDDKNAPDFARCVAIHRKPGYDPAEMLLRFSFPWGLLWLFFKLFLVYALRIRAVVDATPLDCSAIKGSHGSISVPAKYRPVMISKHLNQFEKKGPQQTDVPAEDVFELLWCLVTNNTTTTTTTS